MDPGCKLQASFARRELRFDPSAVTIRAGIMGAIPSAREAVARCHYLEERLLRMSAVQLTSGAQRVRNITEL
jgi:hypothetical protein